MTDAKEMIQKALREMGADGLCNPGEECGCGIEDPAPCENCNLEYCQAAKWCKPKKDDPDYLEEFEEGYYKVME